MLVRDWHSQYVTASQKFIRPPINGGPHGARDDSIEVVRRLVQTLGNSARWQPDRVQPDRRHHILGDLDTVHARLIGQNRGEGDAKGRISLGWPLERIGMGLEKRRLHVPHEGYVKEVEPERGLIAFIRVSMPAPGWG